MRITNKQLEEIDFLTKYCINNHTNDYEACQARIKNLPEPVFEYVSPTSEQMEQYINWSVNGKTKDYHNPLFEARRSLDIQVKMWREDLQTGLFCIDEILDDFKHPYAVKLFKGILLGADFSGKTYFPEFKVLNMLKTKSFKDQ